MVKLSRNQESFIRTMTEDEEFERHGFELLLKRPGFETFFDSLAAAGLFEPSRNLGPVSGDKPGFYRVPYWPPLAYLEAVAKLAGERTDEALAAKVMNVIRPVSRWRDREGNVRDNHNTWFTFAKILGLLPTQAVTMSDIDLMPSWLGGRFDRSMVGHALVSGTLQKFTDSEDPANWAKACRILYHCTAIELIDDNLIGGKAIKKARTLVDDFWLKEVVNSSAATLGRKLGRDAADVFMSRLNEVFAQNMEGHESWLFRAAVEDHDQNHEWNGPENRCVEGLRNTLLAWVDSDAAKAHSYIDGLLASGSEIVERVAIYVVDQRFEALRNSVPNAINPAFFNSGHLHELYQLLKRHFRTFTDAEKAATVATIRSLPLPDRGDDSIRLLHRAQRNWLSAIAGQEYQPADTWFAELNADATLGALSPHPDLNSYHETHSGFGPAPYSGGDLVAFAKNGTIIDKLNDFTPSNVWDGPTKRSLADAVVDAVGLAPQAFIYQLPAFLNAKAEYQYAVIAGLKKLWDAWDGKQDSVGWNEFWPKLIDFFERLLNDENFWAGEAEQDRDEPLSPNRDWVPPVIAEFLRAGTRSDDKAFAPDLLSRTLPLVKILLAKADSEREAGEGDALNRAINTSKGKAIEALLDHALRICRLSDQAKGSHEDAWRELQPIFDVELDSCRDGNFGFSALAGAYIGNLHYMNAAWLHANFRRIFPLEFPSNCLSALDGLAFSPAMRPIYQELVDTGVLDWALRREMKGEHARENLVQRMALAYLWGQEELDTSRFGYLFDGHRTSDLEVACKYFWAVRGEPLTDEQKERILLFWNGCLTWSGTVAPPPSNLLSAVSLLSCYLTSIGQRELGWLLSVAQHVSVDYNADRFIEELGRLAEDNPAAVGQVLNRLLETYHPVFDFKDKLKNLVTNLAAHAESRADAIICVERIRHLPGMVQLYAQLSSSNEPIAP